MIKIFLISYLICLCLASDKLRVRVEEGMLQGMTMKNLRGNHIQAFLGVPYAKPPTDQLRFTDPQPAEKWSGAREAMIMPDNCIQYAHGQAMLNKDPFVGKEDCLYLNIYKPIVPDHSKLPVLVFIHGGGFAFGGIDQYTHKNILDQEVVLVLLQYRIGIFGFLSTDEPPLTGNYGLKDQQLALKWIKKNIAKFNGDPEMITIMGESAGAASVHYQILSPGSNGLFNRAIMISGTALCPWAFGSSHRQYSDVMGTHFGCPLEEGSQKFRECMLTKEAIDITKYYASSMEVLSLPNAMVPRVDGEFLPSLPELLQKYQLYEGVDVMMGLMRDEGAVILAAVPEISVKTDLEKFHTLLVLEEEGDAKFQKDLISFLINSYQGSDRFADDEEMIVKLIGDRLFNFAHHVTAQYFSKNENTNTYTFELRHKTTSPNNDMFSSVPQKYIHHSEDLRLLFNGGQAFPLELVDSDDMFVKMNLLTSIVSFMRSGNPSSRTTFGSKWTRADDEYLQQNSVHYIYHPSGDLELDDYTVDELLKFWYALPLKQIKLLRSDNERKIKKIYNMSGEEDNCSADEKGVPRHSCTEKLSSANMEDWIEEDEFLQDYEWIKKNDFARKH